jgi:hypothetical protein
MRGALRQAVGAFYAVLDQYTLGDLVHNRAALAKVIVVQDLPAQLDRRSA